jgi:hypothetical protein
MPAVYPSAAALAAAMVVDVLRHDRLDERYIDDVLLVGAVLVHVTAAVGAGAERYIDLGVDMLGDRPMRRRVPGLSPRLLGVVLALASAERRCLALAGSLRLPQPPLQVLELLAKPLVLFLQRVILGPQPCALGAQQQAFRAGRLDPVVHVDGWDAVGR